jgi:hypothetical protein
METLLQLSHRFLAEANVDIGQIIKALIDTSFGGSNEEQMKAVQLLKGLALSDDPASNKFMKALDKATSSMKPEDFTESADLDEGLKPEKAEWEAKDKKGKVLGSIEAIGQKDAHRKLFDSLDKKAKAAWDKDGNIVEKK